MYRFLSKPRSITGQNVFAVKCSKKYRFASSLNTTILENPSTKGSFPLRRPSRTEPTLTIGFLHEGIILRFHNGLIHRRQCPCCFVPVEMGLNFGYIPVARHANVAGAPVGILYLRNKVTINHCADSGQPFPIHHSRRYRTPPGPCPPRSDPGADRFGPPQRWRHPSGIAYSTPSHPLLRVPTGQCLPPRGYHFFQHIQCSPENRDPINAKKLWFTRKEAKFFFFGDLRRVRR